MARNVIAFEVDELKRLGELPRGGGCDFCAGGPPAWRYPASDTSLATIVYGDQMIKGISVGAWRACEDCAELIEAGDWPALARRTLRSLNLDLSHAGPGMRVRLLAQFHAAHERFRKARNGPREPARSG